MKKKTLIVHYCQKYFQIFFIHCLNVCEFFPNIQFIMQMLQFFHVAIKPRFSYISSDKHPRSSKRASNLPHRHIHTFIYIFSLITELVGVVLRRYVDARNRLVFEERFRNMHGDRVL